MSKLEVTIKDLETGEIKSQFTAAAVAGTFVQEINIKDIESDQNKGEMIESGLFEYGDRNAVMEMAIVDNLQTLRERIEENPMIALARAVLGKIAIMQKGR